MRCPACRHFEAGECHHPHEAMRYTPDGEAAKNCPTFRSRNEVRDSRMHWNVPAPVWVSALLLLVMVALGVAAWFIDPAGRYLYGNPLRLETVVPAQVTVGQPFTVTMRITNLLDRESTHIYIEIGDKFLANAMPAMPAPEPLRIGHYKSRLLLEYDPLQAGGQSIIQLPFTPIHKGNAPFVAKVYAPSNQLRHIVNVPIVMKDPGLAQGGRDGMSLVQ